jgi:hypothetical protein
LAKREAADLPKYEATKWITKRFQACEVRSTLPTPAARGDERRRPGRAAERRRLAKKPLAPDDIVLKLMA